MRPANAINASTAIIVNEVSEAAIVGIRQVLSIPRQLRPHYRAVNILHQSHNASSCVTSLSAVYNQRVMLLQLRSIKS